MASNVRIGSLQSVDRNGWARAAAAALGVAFSVASLVGCTAAPSAEAIPPLRQGVATANQQSQNPIEHTNPKRGRPHFHPVDKDGKKKPGPHYEYPRS